jgi:archaellum component FlaC
MLRITDTLPPFWWLNPWGLCRSLHSAVLALKVASDIDDRLIQQQDARIRELEDGLDRLHAAIITGGAIVPDAEPEQEGADL